MFKKIFYASLFLIFFALPVSAFASSAVYYDISKLSDYDSGVDTTSERLSVSYLKKGNTIIKSGSDLYINRSTVNSNDCFAELVMPDAFAEAENFVIDFVFNPVQINTTLRVFRANRATSGSSYNFVTIHPGTDTPAKLSIMGRSGYISIPEGDTRISICVDLKQKKADVYVGSEVISDVSLDIIDNLCIRSFWIGTDSGGGNTEFWAKNIKIYSGSEPADTSGYSYIRPSVMDKNDGSIKAKKLLDSSMAFGKTFVYNNGKKLNPVDAFGSAPYMQGDVLMIPCEAARQCLGETINSVYDQIIFSFGTAYTGQSFYTKNDGTTIPLSSPIVIRDDNIFVPLVDLCDALGFNYYADTRGFVIVNKDSVLKFSNSPVTYNNSESSDIIYRYLHFDRPSASELIDTIQAFSYTKPAFLADEARMAKVLANIKNNNEVSQMAEHTLAKADALVGEPCVEYKFQDGFRILESCQSVKTRMLTLCSAYLISDVSTRDKYASQIWAELQNCLDWPDWNTSKHFLDSGMLAPGVAVAYDTLREYLTDTQKEWVRQKVYDQYLAFCINAYQGAYSGSEFRYSTSNWGAVCSGGILSICLAFAPDVSGSFRTDIEYLIENAMHSLEFPATQLYPDGAWYEGVGYGGYVGEFLTSYCIAPLMNYALSDYGFISVGGYSGLYDFPLSLFGPAGIFNYSDNGWARKPYYAAYAYQAALLSQNDQLMSSQKKYRDIFGGGESALNVLWYEPSLCTGEINLPKDVYYSGAGKGVMRSSFSAKSAAFVAMSAGINTEYGSHFDKGSFVFDQGGVRWAIDLGSDNYNVVGGYHGESGRTLYRKRTEGHNCVVINPTSATPGQLPDANTYLSDSAYNDASAYMVYNLTDAYADNVKDYKRGFYFGDGRESLVVRDEISLKSESDIYWFMHTEADIVIGSGGKSATLYKDGRELRIVADCSIPDWHFETRPAQPFDETMIRDGEYSRDGITKLTLKARGEGDVSITVKLAPVGINKFEATPISSWQCESKYTPAPISDYYWSGSSINLDINNSFDAQKAFVATYRGSELQSISDFDIKTTKTHQISDNIHTKIFFWDNHTPIYRVYEFNSERN